jgi:hypothetical protein
LKSYYHDGAKIFDFNPSGGHKGVELFKKGFGTIYKDIPIFIKTSISTKLFFFYGKMTEKLIQR